jgi:hypothetical protein
MNIIITNKTIMLNSAVLGSMSVYGTLPTLARLGGLNLLGNYMWARKRTT